MNTHSHPFLEKGLLDDEEGVTAAVLMAGHQHYAELVDLDQSLLRIHTMLHLTGMTNSPEHEQCLDRLAQVEKDMGRAIKAAWS